MKRTSLLLAAVLLLLTFPACEDSDIALITDKLDEASIASKTAGTAIEGMYDQGFLSAELALDITQAALEFDRVLLEAIEVTRAVHSLDQPQRDQIIEILQPVLEALDRVIQKTELIESDKAKLAIRAGLITAQTALEHIQAVIKSRS